MRIDEQSRGAIPLLENQVEQIIRGQLPFDYAQHQALLLDMRDYVGLENRHCQIGLLFVYAMQRPRKQHLAALDRLAGPDQAGALAHLALLKAMALRPERPNVYAAAVSRAYDDCPDDRDVLEACVALCSRHIELGHLESLGKEKLGTYEMIM